MDLIAEYNDMIATVPNHIAVTYKFFQLFTCMKEDKDTENTGKLFFGEKACSRTLSEEEYYAFRSYLRKTRTDLSEGKGSIKGAECARRMWFWGQKLHELSVFDSVILRDIIAWMEVIQYIVC